MSGGASLNHIFRTVWNQAIGAMVAVAETDSSVGRSSSRRNKADALQRPPEVGIGLLALSVAVAWGALAPSAHANPTGGVAIVGQATVVNNGNAMQVTTQNGAGTNFSAINWQSFSIPAGSSTHFQQPNAASTSINRVVTNTPSQLFGSLSSNGNLVLVNQAGIAVGTGAVVDTAGFTASSLVMSDQDAMAGRLRFGNGSISTSDVSVNGTILARTSDVVLLGPNVQTGQNALVQAPNGSTILAAGQQIDITGRGLEGISLQVQAPSDSAVNLGSLQGDAVGIFAGTLKHSGLIQATAVSDSGGRVTLKAADVVTVSGQANAVGRGGVGGEILVSADKVLLQSSAVLDASGANGGGEVLVGGGWQGHDARLTNASQTVVATGAQLKADALVQGNGGTAVVWSDGATRFGGNVSARGGEQGGNGGRAEVSGKQYLDFQGTADLRSNGGVTGLLLLDPASLTIGTVADIDGYGMSVDVSGNLSYGQYLGVPSQITAAKVGNLLNSADLSLAATGDITVSSAITKSSGSVQTLTLQSTLGSVVVNAAISGTSGSPLNVALNANSDVIIGKPISTQGGTVSLSAGNGSITQSPAADITASSLSASAYSGIALTNTGNSVSTFSGSVLMTGGVDFTNNGALTLGTISVGPSSLTINNNGPITQSSGIAIASNVSFSTSSGSITLTDPSNNFSGSVILNTTGSNNASLKNIGSVDIGASTVGGVLSINSSSSITQTGPIHASTLDLTLNGGATLTDSTNQVSTLKVLNTGTNQVSYYNNGALALGPITTGNSYGGDVEIRTFGGNLTQTGDFKAIGGTTTLNAGAGSINLSSVSNDFNSLSMYGSQIFVQDTNDLSLSGVNATGSLRVLALGNLDINGTISSSASGDAISFQTSGIFNGSDGSISTGTGGRWLAYVADSTLGHTFPFSNGPDFKQYNAPFGSTVLGSGNGLLDATPRFLSASATGAVGKIYDGSTSISSSGASVSGLSGALGYVDVSAAVASVTSATLSDPNVGTGKAVTLTGTVNGVVGGSLDYDFFSKPIYGYQLSASGNIGAVTAAQASVSLSGSRPYDGTNIVSASIFSIAGLAPNETLTLSGAGSVLDKNVGSNKIVSLDTLALGNGTGLASNYTFSGGTAVATITPATISGISGIVVANKMYDGSTSAAVSTSGASFSGKIGSDVLSVASASGAFTDKNAGTGKLVAITGLALSGADAGNYTLSSTASSTTADITAKALGVSDFVAANKVYDGTLAAVLTGGALSGAVVGDAVSLNTPVGAFGDKNVGTGKLVTVSGVSLSGADAGNYSLSATTGNVTADITAKALGVSDFVAANKVYDGTLAAVLTGGALSGAVVGDAVSLNAPVGAFGDKNVGTGKLVTVSGVSLSGADAGNYSLMANSATATANITPKPLTVTGVQALNKVYDGKTDAPLNFSAAALQGAVAGDSVSLAGVSASFANKDVGVGKTVSFSGLTLAGSDAGNYIAGNLGQSSADITVRPLSTWMGPSSGGSWSDAANWDALPDASNVATVSLPSAGKVVYDAAAGSTNLQSLSGTGTLAIAGGRLTVSSGVSLQSYEQTGGALATPGAVTVSNNYSQTSGTLVAGGAVAITQASGDLQVGSITAGSINLTASGGIGQTAGLITSGLLTTQSGAATVLRSADNRVGALKAASTGAGNIEFTNVGVLDIRGLRTTNGSIVLNNTGGISTSGPVVARGGKITGVANSPLTIGLDGLSADGDISLTATNLTSAGNITLNGPIESVSGGVDISAASNLTQNASILAPLGVRASAGGTLTFGPLATAGYQPVSYLVNNQPVNTPRSPESSTVATEQIVLLMQSSPDSSFSRDRAPIDILLKPDKERDLSKELIVSEGPVCRP